MLNDASRRSCALDEQLHGWRVEREPGGRLWIGKRERWNDHVVFRRHMQHGPTGDQHFEPGARLEQPGDQRSGGNHLLEVVQREQDFAAAQVRNQQLLDRAATGRVNIECRRDGRDHVAGIADGGQQDDEAAVREVVRELGSHLQGDATLP